MIEKQRETPIGKFILAAALVAAMIGITFYAVQLRSRPAPEVTFTTIAGEKIPLSAWRGKPVIVMFWATDCPACLKEIPHWQQLYRQYHAQGLEMIAVTMYYDPPSRVVAFAHSEMLAYPVALDFRAEHAKAFGRVELTPTTFVIDGGGDIVKQITGMTDPNAVKNLIEQLLTG